jgi:alkanesulfonate monooxygenase SsuD/methylene tetrahydromethanopterin reductase-like flavin-dependent oxidoreductase (luciferase family)
MRQGVVLPNWEAGADVSRLVEAAVAAEAGGWDGVFLADHLVFPPPSKIGDPFDASQFLPFPDPWIVLTAIAMKTRRVILGTWVTPVPRRQPWQVARDLATLDRLSGGRVMFGVGLGRRPDYEMFGQPWDFKTLGEKADEALAVIDRLWRGESVSYRGRHFTVDGVAVLPTPVQLPRIPIVVGGLWPRRAFLRRGARWDGIMPHFPGDGILPGDGVPPEQHVQGIADAYLGLTDTPGEFFLPHSPVGAGIEYRDLCERAGATWLYTARHDGVWSLDLDVLARGPQV